MVSTPSPTVTTSRRKLRMVGRTIVAGTVAVSINACSAGPTNEPTTATSEASSPSPSLSPSPSPSVVATATVGPGRGTVAVGGNFAELPVMFTMPAGWEMVGDWVAKSDNYGWPDGSGGPPFGFLFMDVANVYADGCRWRPVDPPPGPTVDDLVSAYANLPGSTGAKDTTVDGFPAQLVEYEVPDYDRDDCREKVFALFDEDGVGGDEPSVLAQHPKQQNLIWILEVSGSRLVLHTSFPPNISAADRAEIDAIVDSIQIG